MNTSNGIESDPDSLSPNAIAVVGMAGRFPGANSVSALWRQPEGRPRVDRDAVRGDASGVRGGRKSAGERCIRPAGTAP